MSLKLTPVAPLTLLSLLVTTVVTLLLTGLAPAAHAAPGCDGRDATIVGTPGNDTLLGTGGRDVIVGLAGDDRIRGLGGNDVLCGGDGRDRVEGGVGNDRVFGQRDRAIPNEQNDRFFDLFGDRVIGGAGNDLLDPGFDTRPSLSRDADVISFEDSTTGVSVNLVRGRATGQGTDRLVVTRGMALITSRFADEVVGTARADEISTGGGDDAVRSRGAADSVWADGPKLIGRGGDDVVRLGAGGDYSVSGKGDDKIIGGSGGDIVIDNGRSADVLKGGLDRDSITDKLVEDGEQRLVGGPASDSAKDELALDRVGSGSQPGVWDMTTGVLTVGASPTVASVVLGFKTTILPRGIAWVIDGSPRGESVLVFDGGADITYRGHGGPDEFFGARGDDIFDGGPGVDYAIDMGPGSDTCIAVEDFGAGVSCETRS